MNEQSHTHAGNVVQLPIKPRDRASVAEAIGGGHDDPRTQEALRLIQSFLAIEDASTRAALVALAESLVTDDWLRRTQQR
jgi:hypothetical protein